MTEILINGKTVDVDGEEISCESLVTLSGRALDRLWTISVHYRDHKGRLPVPGESVPIEAGMKVDIGDTSRA